MHEAARPIRTDDLIGCHGNRAQIDILGSKPVNEIVVMTTAILSKKINFLSLFLFLSLSLPLSSSLSLSLSLSHSLSLSLSLYLSLYLTLTLSLSHSLSLYPLLSYRPFASSAENRTRASRFGGGEPTTTLANGRCRG